MTKVKNQTIVLLMCGLATLVVEAFSYMRNGNAFHPGPALIGMVMIAAVCLVSMKIKEAIPLKIPAFAWASLIALLLTTPACPIQQTVLKYMNEVSTGSVSTLILAVAGVSIGNKLGDLKKLSWKMIIVACVVFCGTFFGSAIIAQIMLKLRGTI